MNFLAHIFLSGSREGVMMGNYVGDFIKGKLTPVRTAGWPADYLLGVRLHRFIDDFTDFHPVVREAKAILAQTHPKVAGVALDIYFDYFLANHFARYSTEDLQSFVQEAYGTIQQNRALLPESMLPLADSMIRHDWLYNYRCIAGIKRSFDGLARRYAFMKALEGAETELLRNQEIYENAFLIFFPELIRASKAFIQPTHSA
jgi:acyl carrier protein phosphodiesterase